MQSTATYQRQQLETQYKLRQIKTDVVKGTVKVTMRSNNEILSIEAPIHDNDTPYQRSELMVTQKFDPNYIKPQNKTTKQKFAITERVDAEQQKKPRKKNECVRSIPDNKRK